MGLKKKHAKGRLDKYYHMAKEQGYRARSAFKLIQLNKKFGFLEKAKVLVDLCAAPGGWLQVAAKYMPRSSLIIGLDLAPIKPVPGCITHIEDITSGKCRTTLKNELKTWKADVFLHDGAPNVGTSWAQDAFAQSELTLSALKLATEFLVPNGTFVTKVFRSKDYNKLLWVFNELFDKVEATKPASSRNVSAEIFVVCKGFKAPKKIDPKFLDPKYVFKEVDDTTGEMDEKKKKERNSAILNDLLHPEKKRRHREGYADGATVLYFTHPVDEFISSSEYVSMLASSNTITFNENEESKKIADHPLTTQTIKDLFADLRVLGKRDFKDLMRWRSEIRVALGMEVSRAEKKKQEEALRQQEEAVKQAASEAALETPEGRAEEMAERLREMQLQQKREKRKARERKAKELLRLNMGMAIPMEIGVEADGGGMDGLLQEDSVENEAFLEEARARSHLGLLEGSDSDDSDDERDGGKRAMDEDEYAASDSEDEAARKVGMMEEDIEHLRKKLQRDRKALVKSQTEKKQTYDEWYGIEWDKKHGVGKTAEDGEADSEDDRIGDGSDSDSSWGDSSEDEDEREPGKSGKRKRADVEEDEPLDPKDGTLTSEFLSKRAKVFFDNPLFKNMATSETEGKGRFSKEMTLDSDSDDSTAPKKDKKKSKSKSKSKSSGFDSDDDVKENKSGFEVVKSERGAGQDADMPISSSFIIDTAEKYSLGQKITTKSGKRDLIDDAFHRYAFNDPDSLPPWFVDEERRHTHRPQPVTKEAIEIMKARLKALDARPIKKVAEAKFRQKLRAQNKVEKALKKASAIADDDTTSELTKLKDAAKVMAKAMTKKKKKEVQVVVAKHQNKAVKGRPKGVKGRYKMVDGVMKKEARAAKRLEKAGKKKRR
ncbi:Spb1 C-terminal domain-containing protein [Zopfochytrium polystomum]|nr:Spb1 C-terminal domain-containing protein [Zopfochytrium polystomum]